ncbi:hypothetical protein G6F35_011920 [Rhizopus arrhizus]|nr:hypothetical protein G6F35_011920 [Rhizopus arrhizus]
MRQHFDAFADALRGQAVQLAEVGDVLARGQALVDAARIGQHAKMAPHFHRVAGGVDAVDADAALVGCHQRVQHAHGGGLAGAIGAEQAGDLAIGGTETDVGHRLDAAGAGVEGLVQVVGDDHGAAGIERLGIGGVDELAKQPRHAAGVERAMALPAGDQRTAIGQALEHLSDFSGAVSAAGAGWCGHTGQAAKNARAASAPNRASSLSAGAWKRGASSLQITDHCMPRLIWKSMLRVAPRTSEASGAYRPCAASSSTSGSSEEYSGT